MSGPFAAADASEWSYGPVHSLARILLTLPTAGLFQS